jgi:hypothetical protein
MKVLRSALLAWTMLAALCGVTFAENAPLSPELMRALLQAKNVYVLTGHVRYFKTKFIKTQMVDETPFEEPCSKELEKWGRFKVVSDPKSADLIVRAYMTGNSQYVPAVGPGVSGSVDAGQRFIVLDVMEPSSQKILWSASKNTASSWSTNSAVAGLVKQLREYVEAQEKSASNAAGSSLSGIENGKNDAEQSMASTSNPTR